jgi:hypothetical protein
MFLGWYGSPVFLSMMLLLDSIIGDGECDIDLTSTAAADILVVFDLVAEAEDEAVAADFLSLVALISPL